MGSPEYPRMGRVPAAGSCIDLNFDIAPRVTLHHRYASCLTDDNLHPNPHPTLRAHNPQQPLHPPKKLRNRKSLSIECRISFYPLSGTAVWSK